MRKKSSTSYTQLTLDFEYESPIQSKVEQPRKAAHSCSKAQFDAWQAIEHDLMHGRGDYLYRQLQRHLDFQRKTDLFLRQLAAMRAGIYS